MREKVPPSFPASALDGSSCCYCCLPHEAQQADHFVSYLARQSSDIVDATLQIRNFKHLRRKVTGLLSLADMSSDSPWNNPRLMTVLVGYWSLIWNKYGGSLFLL